MLKRALRRGATGALATMCCLAGLGGVVASAPSAGAAGAAATSGAPVGSFDSVSDRFDGARGISGWASDPAAPDQPVVIYLYIDDYFIGVVQTGDARPDVAAAIPGAGSSTGWHFTTKSFRPPNPTFFCAYAVTGGGATKTPIGCRGYALAAGSNPFNPIASLDAATATPGLIRLRGWAGDRDGDPTTQLRIYYDGAKMLQSTAALPRPDVQAAFGLSPTAGFDLSLPITPGAHIICVYAQNTGNRGVQNTTVGCVMRTITWVQVPGAHDPRGNLESAGFARTAQFGVNSTAPSGWAYDPDASAPVTIEVRALGRGLGDPPNDVFFQSYNGTTGVARPDVQSAFPAAGPSAGFGFSPIDSPFFSGVQLLCAYAVNAGPGADAFLGCKQQ